MIQRWTSVLVALALLCCLLPACAEDTATEKTLPLYLLSVDRKEEIRVLFPDGDADIPYVTAEEMCRLLNLICRDFGEDKDYEVTLIDQADKAVLIRENGADAYIDFESGILSFSQYDRFGCNSGSVNMLDISIVGGAANAQGGTEDVNLILHNSDFVCAGNYTELNLRDYSIPTPVVNGVGCLPLQTFSDLFVAAAGAALCYNGEIVVLAANGTFEDEQKQQNETGRLYYSVPNRERSVALAEFSFNELCLALDFHYGLKKEHGIDSFHDFFIRSGLILDLQDTDAKAACAALAKLCMNYLADGHSAVVSFTPYMQYGEALMDMDSVSGGAFNRVINLFEYYAARIKFYPDSVPGYEEIGNTAYVTFDMFSMDMEKDYYSADVEEEYTSDTQDAVGLLIYAARQIKRENSPIENVVIDLSNNVGGYADVAMCLCSWALGAGTVNIQDMNTGAKAVTGYIFDTNLDHKFGGSEDSVNDKNLFCLISPTSFSCGNLVPAAFKASGRVTLLGKASTGGACIVQPLSTADGTVFCVSGRKRVNTVNNGIFYSVDEGVEPHYYLPKPSMFYDRQKLTDYINELMW